MTDADRIISLERAALDRWGNGDPGGFLDLYAPDIGYFDPATTARLDGHATMEAYYRPFTGKIFIARYDMLDPQVVVDGNMALLSYNLVNYLREADGREAVGTRWNSTVVLRRRGNDWKTIHSHWSFTSHPALQATADPQAAEGL